MPGPKWQYHCNTSLGVVPSGSVMRTLPVNTSDGKVYVSTSPVTSPVLGAGAKAPLHAAPVLNVQPPFSSVKVIVNALAGSIANKTAIKEKPSIDGRVFITSPI